jgi:hypothetical protein
VAFAKIVTVDIGSIAAGATAEATWEVDGDFTWHKLYIVEKTGATVYKVELTIRIDAAGYTEDVVPAALFLFNNTLNPDLDLKISKGQKIVFGARNNETAARNLYAVLELWA